MKKLVKDYDLLQRKVTPNPYDRLDKSLVKDSLSEDIVNVMKVLTGFNSPMG